MLYWNTVHHALKHLLLLIGLLGILSGCGGGGSPAPPPNDTTKSLSGTITSAAGSAIDSDNNDPNASYASNDTPALAQSIANPITLGGYVNVADTGSAGPSFARGDRSDFFRISLSANQSITVNIADFDTGDLDLFLYFDDGSIDLNAPDFLSEGVG
ncbi:MAG: hypothetical protein GXP19_09585 [Gammaproteobacteria bacterium]|nr:hypothetical protein [Gammaproteobacteria bacterium]